MHDISICLFCRYNNGFSNSRSLFLLDNLITYWQDKVMHKKVWHLAWPMILSNITVPLLGLVDTAVMGHLDSPVYLGAVAVGSIIIGVVIWACNFLRMGTTGFASQALGKEDKTEIHAIIWRSLLVAQIIAVMMILLQSVYADIAFHFIDGTTEVKLEARTYFDIRVWGLPASIASFAIVGWFLGLHNTKVPLLLLVITNSLNIILDLVFVIGFGWNVKGAALASIISEYSGLLIGLIFVFNHLKKYPLHHADKRPSTYRQSILNTHAMYRMFSVNRDIFIRTMALELVFFMIAAEGAKLGNDILAANAVLLNFLFLIANGLDGLAQAVEALVGKAIGARDKYYFKTSIVVATGWSVIMSLLYLVLFLLLGNEIISLLTNIESVKTTAAIYLPWLIILPLNGVWSYLLDGIFIGATKATEMRNSMLVATFFGFIPAWWLLQPFGNHGIWLAFHLFMLLRAVVLGIIFIRDYRNNKFISEC